MTPAICVCVFAVATVLLRHSWTTANTKLKYWPSELSTEANEKNDHAMFVVDEKALAQGIFLFKGCLKSRFGLEIEEKRGGSQFSTAPFRGLEGRSRVYLVSFPSSQVTVGFWVLGKGFDAPCEKKGRILHGDA